MVMYGTLYVLLRSEDYALLTGSALVFGVLAIAMILTRRIDWSALARRLAATRSDRGAGATAAGAV
jgi:inner membrane protein